MKLPIYLNMLEKAERTLADSFRTVAEGHGEEPAVHFLCLMLAKQCDDHQDALRPVVERYGDYPEATEGLPVSPSPAPGQVRWG